MEIKIEFKLPSGRHRKMKKRKQIKIFLKSTITVATKESCAKWLKVLEPAHPD